MSNRTLKNYHIDGKTRFYAIFTDVDGSVNLKYTEEIKQRCGDGIPMERDYDRVIVGFATRRQRDRGVEEILLNYSRMKRIPGKYAGLETRILRQIAIYSHRLNCWPHYPTWVTDYAELRRNLEKTAVIRRLNPINSMIQFS